MTLNQYQSLTRGECRPCIYGYMGAESWQWCEVDTNNPGKVLVTAVNGSVKSASYKAVDLK